MDKKMYVIQVIDSETNLQVQRSFAHTWEECEALYFELQEEFDKNCRVMIIPASKQDFL